MASPNWRWANRQDILLYNSGGFVFAELEEAVPFITGLLREYDPPERACGSFGMVSLLDNDDSTVLFDLRGQCLTLTSQTAGELP
jgi:hypothetical protein